MMRSLSNLLSTLEAQIGPAGLVGLLFGLAALLGLIFGASLMGIVGASRKRRALRESEEEQELLQNSLNDTRLHGSRLQAENNVLKDKIEGASERDANHGREIRQLSTELKAAHISLEAKEHELSEKSGLLHEQSLASVDVKSNQQTLDLAVRDAMEKGRSEGLESGLKQGRSEGLETGRKQGLEQGREEARTVAAASSKPVGASAVVAGLGAAGLVKASEPPTLTKRVRSDEESSLSSAEAGIIPDDQIIPDLPEAELTANVEAYDLSELEDLVGEDL